MVALSRPDVRLVRRVYMAEEAGGAIDDQEYADERRRILDSL